jgi:hypothetical protein
VLDVQAHAVEGAGDDAVQALAVADDLGHDLAQLPGRSWSRTSRRGRPHRMARRRHPGLSPGQGAVVTSGRGPNALPQRGWEMGHAAASSKMTPART